MLGPSIKYALAEPIDLASIKELLTDCGLPSEDVEAHLGSFVVAFNRGVLIGAIGLEPHGEIALVRSLAVREPFRLRGVGQSLFERIVARAYDFGVTELYLLTETAASYFERRGFQVVERGSVPESIQGTLEFARFCPDTAIVMKRPIGRDVRYFPAGTLPLRPEVDGARMWGVALEQSTLTYYEMEPHSRFGRHSHRGEQITMVLSGEMFVEVRSQVMRLGVGEVIAIPAGVPHDVFTRDIRAKAVDARSQVGWDRTPE